MKYALLIVDMINEFVKGGLSFEGTDKIIKPNQDLINAFRKNKLPVIYACDSHYKKIDAEFNHWDEHALKNDSSSLIIDELKPNESDYIIIKRRYSAFFNTDLILLAKELNIDCFILTGLQTHICVIHSCSSAFMYGYKTILASDATDSTNKEDYLNACKYMQDIYGTKLMNSKEIIKLINK